jgi:hypothetical protein
MPFCSIEEAWGVPNNPDLKYLSGNDYEKTYKQIYLENSEIYDADGNSIRKSPSNENTNKPVERVDNYSRNYNRLPETSGPTTRLPIDNQNNRVYMRNEPENTMEVPSNHPSLYNRDLPINNYNYKMAQQKPIRKEAFGDIDNNDSRELMKIVRELRNENKSLKKMVDELKHSSGNSKDSLFDTVVYISTGMFVILMMENVSSLIRRF